MSSQMCWYQADCIYCVGCIAVWFTSIWQTEKKSPFYHWFADGCWRLMADFVHTSRAEFFENCWHFCVSVKWTLLKRVRSIWSCWFWKIVAIHWEEIVILSLVYGWLLADFAFIRPWRNLKEIAVIFVFVFNELCWKNTCAHSDDIDYNLGLLSRSD